MKKLFLIPFLAFVLFACADKEAEADRLGVALENSSGDLDNITILDIMKIPLDIVNEKEGYEKAIFYRLNYQVKGQQYDEITKYSFLDVSAYKKDDNLAYFRFYKTHDERFENAWQECNVVITENKMTSEDCGNKEGEDVTKILNAINHMAYFDY